MAIKMRTDYEIGKERGKQGLDPIYPHNRQYMHGHAQGVRLFLIECERNEPDQVWAGGTNDADPTQFYVNPPL